MEYHGGDVWILKDIKDYVIVFLGYVTTTITDGIDNILIIIHLKNIYTIEIIILMLDFPERLS